MARKKGKNRDRIPKKLPDTTTPVSHTPETLARVKKLRKYEEPVYLLRDEWLPYLVWWSLLAQHSSWTFTSGTNVIVAISLVLLFLEDRIARKLNIRRDRLLCHVTAKLTSEYIVLLQGAICCTETRLILSPTVAPAHSRAYTIPDLLTYALPKLYVAFVSALAASTTFSTCGYLLRTFRLRLVIETRVEKTGMWRTWEKQGSQCNILRKANTGVREYIAGLTDASGSESDNISSTAIPRGLFKRHGAFRGEGIGFQVIEVTRKGLDCVVKKVRDTLGGDLEESSRPGLVERLRNEADIIDELQSKLRKTYHPHLPQLTERLETDISFLITMLPVADCDLHQYLQSRTLTKTNDYVVDCRRQMMGWLGCLSKTLAHIHHCGYLHNDIKLKNILVVKNSVCITDYGGSINLGACEDSMFRGRNIAVSERYCALEIIEARHFSYPADVFSLGVVMLKIITRLCDPEDYGMLRTLESRVTNHYAKEVDWIKQSWLPLLRLDPDLARPEEFKHVKDQIARMLAEDPSDRPLAKDLVFGPHFQQSCCPVDEPVASDLSAEESLSEIQGAAPLAELLYFDIELSPVEPSPEDFMGAGEVMGVSGEAPYAPSNLPSTLDTRYDDRSRPTTSNLDTDYGTPGLTSGKTLTDYLHTPSPLVTRLRRGTPYTNEGPPLVLQLPKDLDHAALGQQNQVAVEQWAQDGIDSRRRR